MLLILLIIPLDCFTYYHHWFFCLFLGVFQCAVPFIAPLELVYNVLGPHSVFALIIALLIYEC